MLLAGCADRPAESVSFAGALAGAGEAARVELSLEGSRADLEEDAGDPTGPEGTLPASGVLLLPGGLSIPIAGNYDPPSETMYVAGGGYVLGGYLEHDLHPDELVFEGQYQGPHGRGRLSLHQGPAEEIAVLCGSFAGSTVGRWAVVFGPRLSTAIAVPFDGERRSLFLVGSLSGDAVSYAEEGGYGAADGATATGMVAADRASAEGQWEEGEDGGEWAAAAAECATP